MTASKLNTAKLISGSFVLGVLVATIVTAYFGYNEIQEIKASNAPIKYSEAVQFMIDNPKYAEKVKKNYDDHVKAAQDAFDASLVGDVSKE